MHLHVRTTMDGKEWREVNGKWQKSWAFRPGSPAAAVLPDGLWMMAPSSEIATLVRTRRAEEEEGGVNPAWWSVGLPVSVPCRSRAKISLCDKSQTAGVRPRISGTSGARSESQSEGNKNTERRGVYYATGINHNLAWAQRSRWSLFSTWSYSRRAVFLPSCSETAAQRLRASSLMTSLQNHLSRQPFRPPQRLRHTHADHTAAIT